MSRQGVLPRQYLQEILAREYVKGVETKCLNPASIDLPLTEEAFRLDREFLTLPSRTVRSHLSEVGATEHDLAQPLEVGIPYLIKIAGTWRLPERVYGYA